MKIYFAGSIRGAPPDKKLYLHIINQCSRYGKVLTEHSFDYQYVDEIKVDDEWIYKTDIAWLREADTLVAEVTSPSLGVGYEIGKAEEWGKPVLCIYKVEEGKKISAMLGGNRGIKVRGYRTSDEACDIIDQFLGSLKH